MYSQESLTWASERIGDNLLAKIEILLKSSYICIFLITPKNDSAFPSLSFLVSILIYFICNIGILKKLRNVALQLYHVAKNRLF